ncbi:FAD:protein FMN transferase [uncultured Leifsonia sp.]|uniref:FAD:protein FMN transferase n=1 Tax=uncultured Leifsonia sp. TaxID=340359 RepID=UPI0028D2154C|nr:FAD:protein FMN transferase [uncultured Leifsonia sp.]
MGTPAAPERRASDGDARAGWTVWGLDASVVVDDPADLAVARGLAEDELAAVTAACSRFDADSELSRLNAGPRPADGVVLSPLLAEFVGVALQVAADTDGAVDPTLGADLDALGYDRDFAQLLAGPGGPAVTISVAGPRRAGWRRTELCGRVLRLPGDLRLDLGATAKAHAADRIARRIQHATGRGALVSLGGDIATAGPAGGRRWEVLVQDLPGDPAQQISLPPAAGLATSSTQKRRWQSDGVTRHHILDPRSGLPAEPVWRSVSVAARSCLAANAHSTAALVRGRSAAALLSAAEVDARLVAADGAVVTTGRWPREVRS